MNKNIILKNNNEILSTSDSNNDSWCENYSKNKLENLFDLETKNQTNKIEMNKKTNQKIYENLVDKVHTKAIDLNILNTLLEDKLKKLTNKQNKKLDKLNYKYKNHLIAEKDFNSKLSLLTSTFKIKSEQKNKKYQNKKDKFEKNFQIYQNKIKKDSEELKASIKKQEELYENKINNKVNDISQKHDQILQTNKDFFIEDNTKLKDFVNKQNSSLSQYDDTLKQKMNDKQLGIDIYNNLIAKKKLQQNKQLKKFIRLHNMFKLPFHYKTISVKNKTTKFTNYSTFKKYDNKLLEILNNNKLIIGILLFSFIVGFINPNFFSASNWLNNIMGNNSYYGLLAIGMTFVILVGGIDLSVGSGLALSGAIVLTLFQTGMSIWLAMLIGFIASILIGLLMGYIISYGKFQAFIVTLIGLLVLSGINRVILAGSPVSIDDPVINAIGSSINNVFPVTLLILIIVFAIAFITLRFTKFGRKIYATGSNYDAARVSGINVKWIVMSTFMISGITVALAALTYISQVKSIAPTTGTGFELDAIAAVVLGGTSLVGGKGSIARTMIGWLVISMLGNIFVFLGLDSNIQLIVKGAIILIAIFLDKNLGIWSKTKRLYKNVLFTLKTI